MLTKNERRILALVADGLTNREIAARLDCCETIAATTMGRVYVKLGLASLPNAERHSRAILMFFTGEAMEG